MLQIGPLQDFNEKMDKQRKARGKGPPAKGTTAMTNGDARLEQAWVFWCSEGHRLGPWGDLYILVQVTL